MTNSGIYEIRNIQNDYRYVGSAVDLDRRREGHFYDLRRERYPNSHLQRSYNKYGEDAFEFNVLEYCAKEDLTKGGKREQYWIDTYIEFYGWENMFNENPTAGSCFGLKWSLESRKKLSKACLGRKITLETRAKISRASIGKEKSLDHRANISKALKGNQYSKGCKRTAETREKMSGASKGKKKSLEHRINMSKAQKGNKRAQTIEREQAANTPEAYELRERIYRKYFRIIGEKT